MCRFGVPRVLISNNITQFQRKKVIDWCKEMRIHEIFTYVGHPQANKQTEVANKILLQHLKIQLKESKFYWADELPVVLWAYCTTSQTSTRETSFCLVYGSKTVTPLEIEETTIRVGKYEKKANDEAMRFDPDVVEERREAAQFQILKLKNMMINYYNKKAKNIPFQVGDLVLKKVKVLKHIGKLNPNWESPSKIKNIYKRGTYRLQDL